MPFSNEIEIAVEALPALPGAAGDLVRATLFGSPDLESLRDILQDSPDVFARTDGLMTRGMTDRSHQHHRLRSAPDYPLVYAASLAFAPVLQTSTDDLVDGQVLLRHSLATMLWSRAIREEIEFCECWVDIAAFLHDVGIVVLNNVSKHNLTPCLQSAAQTQLELVDAERHFYDPNHAEIGSMLCTTWMLPYRFAECMSRHHSVMNAGSLASDCVRLADILATRMGSPEFLWAISPTVRAQEFRELAPTFALMRRILAYRSAVDAEVEAIWDEINSPRAVPVAA